MLLASPARVAPSLSFSLPIWEASIVPPLFVSVSSPLLVHPPVTDNTAFRKLSVLFWNVQGLGDQDKCRLVRGALVVVDTSIVCL